MCEPSPSHIYNITDSYVNHTFLVRELPDEESGTCATPARQRRSQSITVPSAHWAAWKAGRGRGLVLYKNKSWRCIVAI